MSLQDLSDFLEPLFRVISDVQAQFRNREDVLTKIFAKHFLEVIDAIWFEDLPLDILVILVDFDTVFNLALYFFESSPLNLKGLARILIFIFQKTLASVQEEFVIWTYLNAGILIAKQLFKIIEQIIFLWLIFWTVFVIEPLDLLIEYISFIHSTKHFDCLHIFIHLVSTLIN